MCLLPFFLHTAIFRIKLAVSAIRKKFGDESDQPIALLCATNRLAATCASAFESAGWVCHRIPCLRYADRAARCLEARAIISDRITLASTKPFGTAQGALPIVFVGRPSREKEARKAGATFYLPVPVNTEALIEVLSTIKNSSISQPPKTESDPNGLWLDPLTAWARVGATSLALSRRHFVVLYEFIRNPGKLLTTERLCYGLADIEPMTPSTLMTCIWRLRKILRAAGAPDCIETVHHLGYRYAIGASQAASSSQATSSSYAPHATLSLPEDNQTG